MQFAVCEAADAVFDGVPGERHAIGDGAAAGAHQQPMGRDARLHDGVERRHPLGHAERVGFARRPEKDDAVAAVIEKPSAMRDEPLVIDAQVVVLRGEAGGVDAVG